MLEEKRIFPRRNWEFEIGRTNVDWKEVNFREEGGAAW